MERKFSQPVAMPVNKQQYLAMEPKLMELGYMSYQSIHQFVNEYYFLSNSWANNNEKEQYYFIVQERSSKKPTAPNPFYNGAIFIDYNPELFLALASMSEGETYWPGELIIDVRDGEVVKFQKQNNGYIDSEKSGILSLSYFRKMTAEEIINHFEQKRIDEKAEQFADGMLKAVNEWVPELGEPIWVWNDGDEKRRKEDFFAFAGEKVAVRYGMMNEGRAIVDIYDHFAKIDAPVVIPQDEIVKYFAKAYNVPAELIQIEQKP